MQIASLLELCENFQPSLTYRCYAAAAADAASSGKEGCEGEACKTAAAPASIAIPHVLCRLQVCLQGMPETIPAMQLIHEA